MNILTHKEMRNLRFCENSSGHQTSYGRGVSTPCNIFSTCETGGHMENLSTVYGYAPTK